jgi:hypothetical protein
MCGRAARYELVTSNHPIGPASFGSARRLRIALRPGRAGLVQRLRLPRGVLKYVAIRAVDAAGNVGLPLVWGAFG